MILIHHRQEYQKIICFVFACLLPFGAKSTAEEVIGEKRVRVAMRMIGHEVLLSLGDCESRILPIEKDEDHYKIPFESEFEMDPDDIVSIIDQVMNETRISTHYLVEVEQCETKKVVHSYEIGNPLNSGMIPCKGRILPENCYSLLITMLDEGGQYLPDSQTLANSSVLSTSDKTIKESPFQSAYYAVPLLFLIGFIGFYIKKKNPGQSDGQASDEDPNMIFLGASRFDKRNKALSFGNKRVELSHKEAELLSLLLTSANIPIEREVILQRVWGDEGDYIGRTLDVFISKLRKKLEADDSVKIVNIRGVGYKLVLDVPS